MSKKTNLIASLNRARRHIQFVAATPAVVAGFDLQASGNRSYGSNVYVSTSPSPNMRNVDLRTGRSIRAGSIETIGTHELRCKRAGSGTYVVSLHDRRGNVVGRTLTARIGAGAPVDEGCFTWFGPVEDICTPWSDNDPSQCQVVTVDCLRELARSKQR